MLNEEPSSRDKVLSAIKSAMQTHLNSLSELSELANGIKKTREYTTVAKDIAKNVAQLSGNVRKLIDKLPKQTNGEQDVALELAIPIQPNTKVIMKDAAMKSEARDGEQPAADLGHYINCDLRFFNFHYLVD